MKKNLPTFFSLIIITALSLPSHSADPIHSLSKKIQSDLKKKPVSLGVLNFTYSRGRLSTGSYLVSERLVTYLVQDGAVVIERRLLDSLLGEQRFAQIGITNVDSLKKVGQVLGVDAVVVGTLADHTDDANTDVIARVIHVESAEVLTAGTAVTPHIWPDTPQRPATARVSTPVPEVTLGEGSTYASNEQNQMIRISPSIPRTLGEFDQSKIYDEELNERIHIKNPKPMRQQGYRPAPVPGFLPSTFNRVPKGGPQP